MEVSRVCGGIAPVRQRRESGEHGAHAHRCEVQHGVLQGVLARECQCDCPIERGCIVCRGRSFEESRGAVCARWVSNPALRRAEALPAAKPPSVCECVKRRAIISSGGYGFIFILPQSAVRETELLTDPHRADICFIISVAPGAPRAHQLCGPSRRSPTRCKKHSSCRAATSSHTSRRSRPHHGSEGRRRRHARRRQRLLLWYRRPQSCPHHKTMRPSPWSRSARISS